MVPRQTNEKPIPENRNEVIDLPTAKQEVAGTPSETEALTGNPEETKDIPVIPDPTELNKEQPSIVNEENTVTIGGKVIEIKPTLLKYFRNKTASAYGVLKAIPLTEFLTIGRGVLDEKRDGDQMLFDFLIAVFDDAEFVKENYDNIPADVIDKVVKIFGRINGIDEKEETARKNREAQAKH